MRLAEVLEDLGRPVAFHPEMARFLGGVAEALLFEQLAYWTGRGHDSQWVYKTARELSSETALSYKEQKRARRNLREAGLLLERFDRLNHRTFFRIDREVLDQLWESWVASGRPDKRASGAKAQLAQTKPRDPETGRFVGTPTDADESDEARQERIERQRKKLKAQAALLLAQEKAS